MEIIFTYLIIGAIISGCIIACMTRSIDDMIVEPVTWWKRILVYPLFFVIASISYLPAIVIAVISYMYNRQKIENKLRHDAGYEESAELKAEDDIKEFIKSTNNA